MTTKTEIPRTQWQIFCEHYTRQHRGWLASIEIREAPDAYLKPDKTATKMAAIASDLPFQGVTLEDRGTDSELLVTVGQGNQLFTHRAVRPARIYTLETDSGAHEGLCVIAADGKEVRIQFLAPSKPETLDGWVEL